jgi:hypothetical protein
MPASLDNREYFDIVFATENTVLRFIAGQENSCKNLFQWMKVNSTSAPDGGAQRVLYSNLAHWFSLSFPANNSYVGGDAGHDRNIQLRDFGTNNSSLLNNWYRTNDGSGILMNLQERNESTYIFPKTGNIYNLLIIDTSPASSTSVITPFIEVRRAHAEMKVVDSAHNNGTITIT